MEKRDAFEILDRYVFGGEKRNIIEKLATSPERYIGIFRPTRPKAKLIQNLLQSHEIRFGDALEYLTREIISDLGFVNLPRGLKLSDDSILSIDQLFTNGNEIFFLEQKIRDDHDSTKKRGQIKNFESKLDFLYKTHHDRLIGMMYFTDPSLSKNKNYYMTEFNRLRSFYTIDFHLFYGQDFFNYLGFPNAWVYFVDWIQQWKNSLPDFPEINFDLSPNESFEEIKSIEPIYWKRIIEIESIWKDDIIRVLFSNGATLKLLFGYFSQQSKLEYVDIAKSLLEKINKYYY